MKNAVSAGAKSDTTALGHLNGGCYALTLNTTDTNTVGELAVVVNDTANDARPVMVLYQIVEEAIYDALYVLGADGYSTAGAVTLATATQASIDAIEAYATSLITSTAAITAEVVTAQSLPTQGAPPVTANIADAIMWIYKHLRNKKLQTATLFSLLNDDDATVDTKATISDDGTTLTYGKEVTGP